ncbi:MAG: Na/Pi cotransporter family protein [Balneolaceae bacterium]|nr:MAG: Na/Pi cotransporter family protein [Balneolaceae bacterium]
MIAGFELWVFLAGLGIFLFGMHMMEESIRLLSGGAFRSLIRKYTDTKLKAISSGIFSTAILQSSSAVSLMVLAFVGAGIMTLTQAIAVMMGTKVGTTATAWIVAVFGFKFNIDAFSLPLIGIGGLGIILLAKSPRYVNISKFMVAFGFLFMGLDYMKNSVDQLAEVIDPAMFAGYGVIVFAIVGMVMTAIMQSSSATIAIVLTMLFSGVITFSSGAAMVIGANVGTTVTVLLGSIGGIVSKKQAALSQLIFTVSTAVITLLVLPLLTWLVLDLLGFEENLVLGLALFHSIFNVIGVIVFYPFIGNLAGFAEKRIQEKQETFSKYIYRTEPSVSDAGLEALRKEISRQLRYSLLFINQTINPGRHGKHIMYGDLVQYHGEIFEYYTRVISHEMEKPLQEKTDKMLRASRNIMNASKNIYDLRDELMILHSETDLSHQKASKSLSERLQRIVEKGKELKLEDPEAAGQTEDVQELHDYIESEDKVFIKMCGDMLSSKQIKKGEVSFLLMMNRVVTQSNRMLIYSMKTLLERIYDESGNSTN